MSDRQHLDIDTGIPAENPREVDRTPLRDLPPLSNYGDLTRIPPGIPRYPSSQQAPPTPPNLNPSTKS